VQREVSSLELKVPPPALALLLALLMWLVSSFVAPLEVPFRWRVGAALAPALVGLGFSVAGVAAFRRARTTINPTKPATASALVSGGVYRLTRNPMYLGLLLLLLALAVFLSNPVALLLVPVFVLYINRFQITPEERALTSLFGGEYAAYKERVRRWL
jgi:protein-S-isoprenylcysteine O-methyltransferase Ste14